MERKILLNEADFTSICKKGFAAADGKQLSFSSREIATLCQGKILEKQSIEWTGTLEFKFALQDIGFETINEILKRSPIYSDLAGNFLNHR